MLPMRGLEVFSSGKKPVHCGFRDKMLHGRHSRNRAQIRFMDFSFNSGKHPINVHDLLPGFKEPQTNPTLLKLKSLKTIL
jgi:hypothetical protein